MPRVLPPKLREPAERYISFLASLDPLFEETRFKASDHGIDVASADRLARQPWKTMGNRARDERREWLLFAGDARKYEARRIVSSISGNSPFTASRAVVDFLATNDPDRATECTVAQACSTVTAERAGRNVLDPYLVDSKKSHKEFHRIGRLNGFEARDVLTRTWIDTDKDVQSIAGVAGFIDPS